MPSLYFNYPTSIHYSDELGPCRIHLSLTAILTEHHRQTALKKKSKSLTNLNEDETENPPEDPIVLVEEETLSPTTSSTSHKRKALLVTQPSPNVDMAMDVRSRSSSPKRVKKVEEQVEVEQLDIEEVDNSADIDVDSTSPI